MLKEEIHFLKEKDGEAIYCIGENKRALIRIDSILNRIIFEINDEKFYPEIEISIEEWEMLNKKVESIK